MTTNRQSSIWRTSLQRLRLDWQAVFSVHLAYTALGIVLFTPLVASMSLKYEGVQKIRALRPEWTIGLLTARAIGDLASLDSDFLAVARGMATPGFIRRSHDQGKQVFVWTINDAVSLSRMMSLGVDGIITDEPALAREVIAERSDLNPAERLLMHTAVLFGRPEPHGRYRDESP